MIFGRNFVNGHHFILVGLSGENMDKIRDKKPLSIGPVKNDPILENATLIIMSAATEKEIVAELRKSGMMPPETSTNET